MAQEQGIYQDRRGILINYDDVILQSRMQDIKNPLTKWVPGMYENPEEVFINERRAF